MSGTALPDVDGALVDIDYHHALAWSRAFRRYDVTRPLWRIHSTIGMGGDTLLAHVAGQQVEDAHGDDLRDAWVEAFGWLVSEVQPFEDARALLEDVKARGFRVVLASSGTSTHVEVFLDLLDGKSVADAWTSSDDAEHSRPEPDLVRVALDRVDGASGVMIGDSTWDCVAARKLDVPTIAVRTGGFSVEELTEAGAVRVFDSLRELREKLDDTLLARPDRAAA